VTPTKAVATLHPLVDGYCKYSWSRKWHCEPKSFACEGIRNAEDRDDDVGMRVDRRIPEQKEADKQNAADGKDGRCSFRFEEGITVSTKDLFALTEESVMIGGLAVRGGKTTG
jgi:hypothetical protein